MRLRKHEQGHSDAYRQPLAQVQGQTRPTAPPPLGTGSWGAGIRELIGLLCIACHLLFGFHCNSIWVVSLSWFHCTACPRWTASATVRTAAPAGANMLRQNLLAQPFWPTHILN